jgi:uncharacterized phage-like protein YoqJ
MQNVISFTGHRPDKLGMEYDLYGPITSWIENKLTDILINENPDKCISGMALGFDTIAALVCIKLKIPFVAAIPFKGQERMWPKKSQDKYFEIISNPLCTKHYVCTDGYASWKMQHRNIWMMDNCNKVVACWNGSSGGTGNAVKYAVSIHREIIRIDPTDILKTI